MKHLYFVRHGLSQQNLGGAFSGQTDSQLTDEGRHQARLAGQQAKDLNIDYIICSPLSRTRETAKLIAREIGYPIKKIRINSLFIERSFGTLEGKPWEPDMDLDGFSDDMETFDEVLERAKQALDFLQTIKADNVLVVGHGAFGRAIRHYLDPNFPFENKTANDRTALPNAQIIRWI